MILTIWHSGEGKTIEMLKRSAVARALRAEGERRIGGAYRIWGAAKLFCMIQ